MPRAQISPITSHNGAAGRLVNGWGAAGLRHDVRGDGNDGRRNGGKSRDGNDSDNGGDCGDGSKNGNGSHRFRRRRQRPCGGQKAYDNNGSDSVSHPTATLPAAPPASRFSPLAAGFIGALLSFVTVSAIVWGAYFFMRRRRARARRAKAAHPAPHVVDALACQRALTPVPLMAAHLPSSRVASPMPYFVGARDAAAQEKAAEGFNSFVHPQDPRGVDPFADPYEWKPSNAHPSHTLSA